MSLQKQKYPNVDLAIQSEFQKQLLLKLNKTYVSQDNRKPDWIEGLKVSCEKESTLKKNNNGISVLG